MALREGGLPMLAIAAAFRRLNRWRGNCGAPYAGGGPAISPYFGFIVGWITILAYVVGVVSISLPIGPYVVSLFGNSSSRPAGAGVGFIAVVLATVIAYIGIKLTAWTQWVLIAIEYTGVGILAIWCLVAVFSHNRSWPPSSSPRPARGTSSTSRCSRWPRPGSWPTSSSGPWKGSAAGPAGTWCRCTSCCGIG